MNKNIYFSNEEAKEIAGDIYKIKSHLCDSVEYPVVIFVAGQMGAGKSKLQEIEVDTLQNKGGGYSLDLDAVRDYVSTTANAESTQEGARKIIDHLRQMAVQDRKNIIEEGTLKNAERTKERIAFYKSRGYRVELSLLAVPREISLAGTYQRFELQHLRGVANPRYVSPQAHDASYTGMRETFNQVLDKVDAVRISTRRGELLYDSQSTQHQYSSADSALQDGRKLSSPQLEEVLQLWNGIQQSAIARQAPPHYQQEIQQHTQALLAEQAARHPAQQQPFQNNTLQKQPAVTTSQPTQSPTASLQTLMASHPPLRQLSDQQYQQLTQDWKQSLHSTSLEQLSPQDQEHIQSYTKALIEESASRNWPRHKAALEKDSRYRHHSTEELIKVAYCRAIREQANFFEGKETNWERFDSVMSSKEVLERLQDIPGLEELAGQGREEGQSQGQGREEGQSQEMGQELGSQSQDNEGLSL